MRANSCKGRNDIRLVTNLEGEDVSHFRLREFENREGLVMVHASVLESLERVRRRLGEVTGEEVRIIITDAVRTHADLERLAARLGWADEGGLVARRSKHLAEFGGIAVDLYASRASNGAHLPQAVVGAACRAFFDWVKDTYADGHVHADNRDRAHP
jgi:hypothetical protein